MVSSTVPHKILGEFYTHLLKKKNEGCDSTASLGNPISFKDASNPVRIDTLRLDWDGASTVIKSSLSTFFYLQMYRGFYSYTRCISLLPRRNTVLISTFPHIFAYSLCAYNIAHESVQNNNTPMSQCYQSFSGNRFDYFKL